MVIPELKLSPLTVQPGSHLNVVYRSKSTK